MFSFVLKRIALFIPSLILLSLIIFGLSRTVPGSRVSDILYEEYENDSFYSSDKITLDDFITAAKENHWDIAPFYFAIMPKNLPSEVHSILLPERKKWFRSLALGGCDWNNIKEYETEYHRVLNSNVLEISERKNLAEMRYQTDLNIMRERIVDKEHFQTLSLLLNTLLDDYNNQGAGAPTFRWYGAHSQYHRWISKFLTGNMGVSLVDGRSVAKRIFHALGWTTFIGLIVFCMSTILSIILSVALAYSEDKIWSRIVQRILLILYSTPSFWIATLAIVFLTNDHYGRALNWFPSVGIFEICNTGSFFCAIRELPMLLLPILIMTILSLPILVQQLVSSLSEEEKKLYFTKALASGSHRSQVLIREALRNALIPFITISVARIPAIFSGSLIMEIIFNIPGVGKLMFDSVFARDWPVVFSVCLLISIISMLALMFGDILYSRLNPKINFV